MIVMMAVMAKPESNPGFARPNTVFSIKTGKPTQSAEATPEKSTSPMTIAHTYDTITPMRMGMTLIMPRPQTLQTMIVTIAMSAMIQFVEQFSIAELDKMSPMAMTMGPVTTGGK